MNELISKSNDFKQEYCCTIVRIGEVSPIEGSPADSLLGISLGLYPMEEYAFKRQRYT